MCKYKLHVCTYSTVRFTLCLWTFSLKLAECVPSQRACVRADQHRSERRVVDLSSGWPGRVGPGWVPARIRCKIVRRNESWNLVDVDKWAGVNINITHSSDAGRWKTLRGPVGIGGDNLPSPVRIGFTDLPNIGGASGPPGPPGSGITEPFFLLFLYPL